MSETLFNCKSLVIGHRGVKSKIMENTLESILHAIDIGVDGVEFDIQKCITGELVLFHDNTIDMLAFKDSFYFENIKEIPINKLQLYHLYNTTLIDSMGKQYKIPKLTDILYDPRVYGSNILINIEIKDKLSHESLCDILLNIIEEGLYESSRFMVSSYNIDILLYLDEFKQEMSKFKNLKIGYIFSQETVPQIGLLNEIKLYSNILTHVVLDKLMINQEIVDNIINMGLGVFIYTINDKSYIDKINNIEGIITDNPKIFI